MKDFLGAMEELAEYVPAGWQGRIEEAQENVGKTILAHNDTTAEESRAANKGIFYEDKAAIILDGMDTEMGEMMAGCPAPSE